MEQKTPGVQPPLEGESTMEELRTDYAQIRGVYSAAIREIDARLRTLDSEFSFHHRHNPIHHIESRVKSLPSIVKKLHSLGLPASITCAKKSLHDIAGVRVVCRYVDDIYRIANLLLSQDDIVLIFEKDYIKKPKENGYRSLHLIVEIPIFLHNRTRRMKVEVQLRTMSMDWWASLEHKIRYKKNISDDGHIAEELLHCAEMGAALDQRMESVYRETTGAIGDDASC